MARAQYIWLVVFCMCMLDQLFIYNFIVSVSKNVGLSPCNSKTERRVANLSTNSESARFN